MIIIPSPPVIITGPKESASAPIATFDVDRETSTSDRSLWSWKSVPKELDGYMRSIGGFLSGAWVYSPGDYQGWHTNSSPLGQRVYLSWASDHAKSGMRFVVDNQIIDSPDHAGWNLRAFTPPIWHSVYCDCTRVSVGYMFAERWSCDIIQPIKVSYVEDLAPAA